jgi:signal transduction histidine kinase
VRRIPSITRRITALLAVICIIGAIITTAVVSRVIHHEIDELLDHALRESADLIHNVMARTPTLEGIRGLDSIAHDYEEHLLWQVVDLSSSAVVARSKLAPESALHGRWEPDLFDRESDKPGSVWRILTLRMAAPANHLLVVAQSHAERVEARLEPLLSAVITSLLGGLLTTGLVFVLIRGELARLRRLSDAVAQHDPLTPGTALPTVDRQEFQPIVDAVDRLGQRLAQRVVSERAFTAHAAHALRTPLAGLDAQLALARRESSEPAVQQRLERTRAATARLTRVVQALLAMFRSGMEPQQRLVALGDVVAASAFPALEVQSVGDPIVCDPDLLAAVFMNLLDNAQRHGASRVQVQASALGWQTEVTVHDNGEGCRPEQLLRMQDALDRQDYSSGTGLNGLGLVLADLVLRAHGGRVHLLPPSPPSPASPTSPADSTGTSAPGRAGFHLVLRWPQAAGAASQAG